MSGFSPSGKSSAPKEQPSNNPDPFKSPVLRGRNTTSATSAMISPLRIAKRDSPQRQRLDAIQVARRTSSSYKHVRNNNLVSKSPFKSHIPTPSLPSAVPSTPTSPRRVSGEKRMRPLSMHDQAENERPVLFKRRQSKGFQGLMDREPVTNSPFKQTGCSNKSPESSPPPVPEKVPNAPVSDLSASGSPRPALVSKRLHGPRSHEGGMPLAMRRQRRKTVTFNECCDVVEFDQESIELREDAFYSDEDGDEEMDDYGSDEQEYEAGQRANVSGAEHSFDVQGNENIANFVDSMLQATPPEIPEPRTPPLESFLPPGMETENGVPYGRTHHSERSAVHREDASGNIQEARLPPIFIPSTPSPSSSLPSSPSPVKIQKVGTDPTDRELVGTGLVLKSGAESQSPREDLFTSTRVDPLTLPGIKDEPQPIELSLMSDDYLDPASLNMPQVISLSAFEAELRLLNDGTNAPIVGQKEEKSEVDDIRRNPILSEESLSRSTSPFILPSIRGDSRSGSPGLRGKAESSTVRGSGGMKTTSPTSLDCNSIESPHIHQARDNSPPSGPIGVEGDGTGALLNASLNGLNLNESLNGSLNGSTGGRSPRISRENVQKRLAKKRSTESPLREFSPACDKTNHFPEFGEVQLNVVEAEHEMGDGIQKAEMWVKETAGGEFESRGEQWDSADRTANLSAEEATIERAEKKKLDGGMRVGGMPVHLMTRENNLTYDGVMSIDPSPSDIDPPRPSLSRRSHTIDTDGTDLFRPLELDFGKASSATVVGMRLGDMSALDRLMEDVVEETVSTGIKVETFTEGVRAKTFETYIEDDMRDEDTDMDQEPDSHTQRHPSRPLVERAATDSVLLSNNQFASLPPSRNASGSSIPPPVPPKDAIRTREEMILEKRREARRRELGDDMQFAPTSTVGQDARSVMLERSGPTRRRSLSTGDADDILARRRSAKLRNSRLLDMPFRGEDDALTDSIDRELRKRDGPDKAKYNIREREQTIYASSDHDRITHMGSAGDIDNGKAWRTLRRPSDMNEYAKQIKEYRSHHKSGKACGKIFVRVLGVKNLCLPIPQQPTIMTCTLNNGIHYVTTPEFKLSQEFTIDQEFEILEHNALEFTLTLRVRKDQHIIEQFKAIAPPPPAPLTRAAPPASKGGLRNFFHSPKKPARVVQRAAPPPHKLEDNLARYLKSNGTLAEVCIVYKHIAKRCDTKRFETSFALHGQRMEIGSNPVPIRVGEIMLQIFRLPHLPGVPQNQQPQSLAECHQGMMNIHWHKQTYFEGTLTQNGGDCTTWRRRQFRIIGASLVAFNDITKKATATIDLKKAIAVKDDQDSTLGSGSENTNRSSRYADDYEVLVGMERSFRITFPKEQEIVFFADTDDEKARWLEILRLIVGHIPNNPLWAELAWYRRSELSKQRTSLSSTHDVISPTLQTMNTGVQEAPRRQNR